VTYAAQIFDSEEHFYTVMRDVFARVTATPENVHDIAHSNLVIRIRATNPDAEILVDGRQPPLEVFFGKRPGDANIEISLAANLLHAIWLGKESTRQAFFSGQIKTRGNMLKMMRLTELFYECEKVYPAIARAHGLS
jgi:putative sterol carrier protein